MKLKNKKTGEIVEYDNIFFYKLTCIGNEKFKLNAQTISELNEDWEDYEENELYFCIAGFDDGVTVMRNHNEAINQFDISIGNYFKTREEAEKAVEKLKALKRLKDKGFKFTAWKNGILLDETVAGQVRYEFPIGNKDDVEKDLDLLFGGEK